METKVDLPLWLSVAWVFLNKFVTLYRKSFYDSEPLLLSMNSFLVLRINIHIITDYHCLPASGKLFIFKNS